MTSQSIRFSPCHSKVNLLLLQCVKNSVRLLYISFFQNLTSEICPFITFARSLQCTLHANAHAKSPAYELRKRGGVRQILIETFAWNTFTTKLPRRQHIASISNASSTRYMARGYPPPVFRFHVWCHIPAATLVLYCHPRSGNALS